ncbi:MAG: hypothetical protein IKF38_03125 [Clostridia bacterium]|nr:hypothetical protein [Clostridia bacterium]
MLENNEENKTEEIKEEVKQEEKQENKTEEVKEQKKNETTEELKKEASNTVNQVKDTIKNTNIKEDSIETKNFIKEMFSKPATKLKEVVEDTTGKTLKYAIIILAVWLVAALLGRIFGGVFKMPGGEALWSLFKSVLNPLLGIIVFSVLVLLFSKENKKSLTTIISTITIAKVPRVFATVVLLLNNIPGQIYKITSPISSFCTVLTTILLYFSTKSLLNKEDNEAIKSFVGIEIIYLIVDFILGFAGLSI